MGKDGAGVGIYLVNVGMANISESSAATSTKFNLHLISLGITMEERVNNIEVSEVSFTDLFLDTPVNQLHA